MNVHNACPGLTELIGFPVRLPDGRTYKNIPRRDQSDTGSRGTCTFWAFSNAFEALLRGIITNFPKERNGGLMPAGYRYWYRNFEKYRKGCQPYIMIKALQTAGFLKTPGEESTEFASYFQIPTPGLQYFYHKYPKRTIYPPEEVLRIINYDTARRITYSMPENPTWENYDYRYSLYHNSTKLLESMHKFEKEQTRKGNQEMKLGVDYVLVVSIYNYNYQKPVKEYTEDMKDYKKRVSRGIRLIPMARLLRNTNPAHLEKGHSIVLYKYEHDKDDSEHDRLHFWNTVMKMPFYDGIKRVPFDEAHAVNEVFAYAKDFEVPGDGFFPNIRILRWYFVSLSKKARAQRALDAERAKSLPQPPPQQKRSSSSGYVEVVPSLRSVAKRIKKEPKPAALP